jgi:hypothetical protein
MLSKKLSDKLNSRLTIDPVVNEIDELFRLAVSNGKFSSQNDLHSHLTEGALLNVGVLASKALSVPCGDYMVWMTDAGHTMLVPVAESQKKPREVFENALDQYDVFTSVLLQNWNKLEKTLNEDEQPEQFRNQSENDQLEDQENIPSTVDTSTVDRTPLLRAMEDHGLTVTELAKKCGVQAPAISRLLREPKDTQGDPGGRNPSIGLASRICAILGSSPTALFPDIFRSTSGYEARDTPGNRGSGGGVERSGKKDE